MEEIISVFEEKKLWQILCYMETGEVVNHNCRRDCGCRGEFYRNISWYILHFYFIFPEFFIKSSTLEMNWKYNILVSM